MGKRKNPQMKELFQLNWSILVVGSQQINQIGHILAKD